MGAGANSGCQGRRGSAAAADGRPPLVLTIGFSGHRELHGLGEAVAGRLDEALTILKDAVASMEAQPLHADETLADAFSSRARLRLVSGEAPGSDRLAIARWAAAGLGETHRIYPFREPGTDAALTDHPDYATAETRVQPPADPAAWTGFDSCDLDLARDLGHLEVAHWIIRNADVLIAVWDGAAVDKTGGTGATLTAALERGVPVIWVRPDAPQIKLIDPDAVHRRGRGPAAQYAIETAGALTAAHLCALLVSSLAPPSGVRGAHDPEVIGRRDYASADPLRRYGWPLGTIQTLLDHTVWRSYALFEKFAGGRKSQPVATWDLPAPDSLRRQAGFRFLDAMYDQAERRASNLGAIHRSQQVVLVVVATLSVFVGTLPALLGRDAHVAAARVEFALGLIAFSIVRLAWHSHRHRRWSDARRLAERLRAARATWPLCVDIADGEVAPPQTWTEWRARALVRAAGPRGGWITRALLNEEVGWVTSNLVEGQRVYHADLWRAARRIERGIELVGNFAFGFLIVVLAAFLVAENTRHWTHWTPPPWMDGALIMVSAVAPAIGAACLALNATLGFSELTQRSEQMEHEFELMKARLAPDPTASLPHLQRLVRRSAQLLVEDATAWRDRLATRRITLG